MKMYQTTTTARSVDLPVDLQEAKNQLRIVSDDLDNQVIIALNAAVDFCERLANRSLRVSHTLTQSYPTWPCNPIRLDRQAAYSITSVTYYDADNASQTVASSNYRLHVSDGAASYLEIDADYTRPTLYVRDDAVIVTYLAGYASIDSVPPVLKYAILLTLERLWGDRSPQEQNAIEKSVNAMMGAYDWGAYR